MAWNAKPKGAYYLNSLEAIDNLVEMRTFLDGRGYTNAAMAGLMGNSYAESGLNPWRWQSDKYNTSNGYGLFQYTPASSYLALQGEVEDFAPNLSVTQVTEGASPNDGRAQLIVFDNNTLGKWVSTCWRNYWDPNKYPELYALRASILEEYGSGGRLTLSQYRAMDKTYEATFAFLACFEGPAVPNMDTRYEYATYCYKWLTGLDPGPVPKPPVDKNSFKWWYTLRVF